MDLETAWSEFQDATHGADLAAGDVAPGGLSSW
jgi:hypothetical protein